MKAPVMEKIKTIAEQNHFDIYLNLCEEYAFDGDEYEYYFEYEDDLSTPFVYPPTELIFPGDEEFWHNNLKWGDESITKLKRVSDAALTASL